MQVPCKGYTPAPVRLSIFEAAPSGVLSAVAGHTIDGARLIATDPRERFLFVAGVDGLPGYLQSYSVGAAGALTPRSRIVPRTWNLGSCWMPDWAVEPTALVARGRDVLLSREHYTYSFSVVAVENATGILTEEPGPYHDFDESPRCLVAHPTLPIVFANDWQKLLVLSPRADDGRFDDIAQVPTPEAWGWAKAAALTKDCLVTGWSAGGLVSYHVAPETGLLTYAVMLDNVRPEWIASGLGGRIAVATSTDVRVYAVTSSCGLEQRDALDTILPVSGPGTFAFHPSGRFLYTNHADGLQTYEVLDTGRLRLIQTLKTVHGRIA